MKKVIRLFEIIYYIVIGVVLFSLVIGKPLLSRHSMLVFLGIIVIGAGILGLINNEILLTRGSGQLNYKKGSILGKAFNVILIVIGFIVLTSGIFGLIT